VNLKRRQEYVRPHCQRGQEAAKVDLSYVELQARPALAVNLDRRFKLRDGRAK